jgi:hypothetical protein
MKVGCATWDFGDKPRRMLRIIQRFGKHFTLKMATAMSAETLDNCQHSTLLIPENRSSTSNSSRENLKKIMMVECCAV